MQLSKYHKPNCDCYECSSDPKMRKLNIIGMRPFRDYADRKLQPASYYVGGVLFAKKPVNLYSNPYGGKLLKTFPAGVNVGRIYSYIIPKGTNDLWWEVNWFSGQHAGYVKHEKGLFDSEIVEDESWGKEDADFKKKMEEMEMQNPLNKIVNAANAVTTGVTDTVQTVFGNLKWILLFVAFILLFQFVVRTK